RRPLLFHHVLWGCQWPTLGIEEDHPLHPVLPAQAGHDIFQSGHIIVDKKCGADPSDGFDQALASDIEILLNLGALVFADTESRRKLDEEERDSHGQDKLHTDTS